MEKKKILLMIGIGLILYFVSTGISFAAFSFFNSRGVQEMATPLPGQRESGFKVDLSAPKTEVCPLNGGKFTKAERDIWETRRPLAVMIENHEESRPPSGLSRADVVYEAVAEGGITRFLAVFYCGAAAKDIKVAPVRSARIYFIHWAQEYGDKPIFMHVGGANNLCPECPGRVKVPGTVAPEVMAQEYLAEIGWRVAGGNDFDTTFDSGAPVFLRNPDRLGHEVATEHQMIGFFDKAFEQAEKRGFGFKDKKGIPWNKNFVSWKFIEDSSTKEKTVSSIKFGFWDGTPKYNVEWKYDSQTNSYLRFNGGQPHTDLEENNAQITAKNVAVMMVSERDTVDKEGHIFIKTVGNGNAIVFQNGKAIEGTWEKDSEEGRTKFFDKAGREISFVGGQIWIEAVPSYSKVEY